jgi:hypothetical protein
VIHPSLRARHYCRPLRGNRQKAGRRMIPCAELWGRSGAAPAKTVTARSLRWPSHFGFLSSSLRAIGWFGSDQTLQLVTARMLKTYESAVPLI